MNKTYVNKSYMSVYVDKPTVEEFRMYCAKNGLSISSTIAIMIRKYLEEKKDG